MNIHDLLQQYQGRNVILIDLSWMLYRSYYAFKQLTNFDGMPTGQYYGLASQIKMLSTGYPDDLILLVDDGSPQQRQALNENYKGNREHNIHFEDKKHIVDSIIQPITNAYRVYDKMLEADDLLFSISRIKDYNNTFIIYTTDKDLYQAIDSTTKVASEIIDNQLVLKDTNSDQYIKNFKDIEPWRLPYYRACLGDASDNLPSIRPRFPSKVAYYFVKHYIQTDGYEIHFLKPTTKPEDLTESQYQALLEIYSSETFMNNLNLMKLKPVESIPVIKKEAYDYIDVYDYLQLNSYKKWLGI